LGMLFRRELVMFGPREVLLTSDEPVVEQFLNGRRLGPIGMSEEKDEATAAAEAAHAAAGHSDGSPDEDVRGIVPQLQPTPGLPERMAVRRRKDRVMSILHTLPRAAQEGIIESLTPEEQRRYGVHPHMLVTAGTVRQPVEPPAPTPPVRPSPRPRTAPQPEPNPQRFQGDLGDRQIARLPESDWRSPRPGAGDDA
ncbi:MAG TPA: ABC transporter ATP-binding protein, partial [Actinophytocola sp.]|nr:ABC transporter ATP-binding protein [Actinophytocola sp.]